jgi:hypothetical protein
MASCPYCNTPLPASAFAATRFSCSRCGETIPERLLRAAIANGPVETPTEPIAPAPTAGRSRIRWTAAVVAGGMGLMAAAGLAFALWTTPDRRAHDTHRGGVPQAPPQPVLVPADEWDALAYLPADTNLVAGLDCIAARRDPLGEQVFARLTGKDGQPPAIDLPRWTGLDADAVDHAVLGIRLNPLRVILVVRTRRPYDSGSVRDHLHTGAAVTVGGKTIYPFSPEKFSLGEPALWLPNDTVLVVGLHPKYLEAIPERPNAAALAGPLRQLLHDRVGIGSFAWVVGHTPDDGVLGPLVDVLGALLKVPLTGAEARTVAGVRTFGLWLRWHTGLDVQGELVYRDAKSAAFAAETGGCWRAPLGTLLQRGQATPATDRWLQGLTESATFERKEAVLTFATHTDAVPQGK